MKQYEYRQLEKATKEIRLVKLYPGHFDDDIRIEIFHSPFVIPKSPLLIKKTLEEIQKTTPTGWNVFETLEGRYIFENDKTEETTWIPPNTGANPLLYDASKTISSCDDFEPTYEALSYTWGGREIRELAYVEALNGPLRTPLALTTLPLRENLASALRHLRLAQKPRVLWIDALCINQDDVAERSEQVGLMGHIYRLAYRVTVFLGPATEDSTLACRNLRYLGEQVEVTRSRFRLMSPNAIDRDCFRSRHELLYDKKTSLALQKFLQRSWFERLWIWQEVQLSNNRTVLQCGDDHVEWSLFRRAVIVLYEKLKLPVPLNRENLTSVAQLAYDNTNRDLSSLLFWTAGAKYSEPRDRIYALLGLTDSSFSPLIQPDYRLPVHQVIIDAVLAYIYHYQDLRILLHCVAVSQNIRSPSWVPQWSDHESGFTQRLYNSIIVPSRSLVKYLDVGMLEVSGLLYTSIQTVRQADPQAGDILATIRLWEPTNLKQASYISGENLFDAFLATLCTGYTRERWRIGSSPTIQECRESYISNVTSHQEPNERLSDEKFFRLVCMCTKDRAFFMTSDYIGIGPKSAEAGDQVCFLLGCNTPMLLRPQETGCYKLVGPCYIHGLANLEGFLGNLPDCWSLQMRHIFSGNGENVPVYTCSSTGEVTSEDPRLGPLPKDWERVGEDEPGHINVPQFRHKGTAEVTKFDPRLEAEALKARGVKIEILRLV